MRAIRDLGAFTGALALAATLALMSPGVEIARADDATAAAQSADGPTCQAGPEKSQAEVRAFLENIQRLRAEQAATSSKRPSAEGEFVVLNVRDYGYGRDSRNLRD